MLDFLTSFSAFEISILALLVLIFLGQYQLHNRLYEIRRTIEPSIRQSEDYRKESSPHERWIERKLEGIEERLLHIDSIATEYYTRDEAGMRNEANIWHYTDQDQ